MNRLFPKKMARVGKSKLQEIRLQGFAGGWNTVHEDISMDPRFLVNARNVRRLASGSMEVRHGSKWFTDVRDVVNGADIIDMRYFNNRLVAGTDRGEFCTIDDEGNKVVVWNPSIANALPGNPAGWSTSVNSLDFVPFRNQLIVHNGIDKPITLSAAFSMKYLTDLATGSNVNVPIGKYGAVVSNYHCIAGIPALPTTVYISSQGTAGTFPGDPNPNDSISIEVGAYAPDGDEIRGLAGFKQYLLIFFQTVVVPVQLGNYEGAIHKPIFPDALPKFGLLGHRAITQLPNDIQFADAFGFGSVKRNLFTSLLDSKHLSEYIEPSYRNTIGSLTNAQRLRDCFAVYNPLDYTACVFTPSGRVFVHSYNEELKYRAWTYYDGIIWKCGCTSLLGRVFLGKGMRIYQFGNGVYTGERYTADLLEDRDANWANSSGYSVGQIIRDTAVNKSFKCLTAHTSPATGTFAQHRNEVNYWEEYLGEAITWEMETGWLTGKEQMKVKHLRYTSIPTKGTAEFTFKVYTDNLYKDDEGNVIYNPQLTMGFIGNDAPGYGEDAGPMGGGRHSRDPRLYRTPCRFKTLKVVLTGSARKPLTIGGLVFLYATGRYKR